MSLLVMILRRSSLAALVVLLVAVGLARGEDASALRLVPFPKKVELYKGTFSLDRESGLEVIRGLGRLPGGLILSELRRAGFSDVSISAAGALPGVLLLRAKGASVVSVPTLRKDAGPEDYAIEITPNAVVFTATDNAGMMWAQQTLCQLIRANRRGNALPCLSIHDWPSLRWRAFQDDMTRGPSAKIDTLWREVALGAGLKMNLFTYYMEHQFAFQKHPDIGPKDGSLTPDELKTLVAFAKPRQVAILGCQQSFGHFGAILSHPEYAALRETPDVLSPVSEASYRLLDDLYGEVAPLVPFPWFNVCCDETWGLGRGPSKTLAAKIGVGGVYVQHMRRVHDLLKSKYGKRMMMWGDIILQHPDKLDQLPKDTIMLTWGYDPRPSFENQIVPFVKSGYEFFVCPGVDDWNRILPDFGSAMVNIQNFVRDGAKHHALGMLNTEWKDDGETLRAPAWHGYAWGAECAWNASATAPADFNRRIGGVLFGEKGDHFGQAVELLAKAIALDAKMEKIPQGEGLNNARFWKDDFPPKTDAAAAKALADALLPLVRPAIADLETCKREATVNADLLDAFLLGARRIELIGTRTLDGLEAAKAYAEVVKAADRKEKLASLARAEELVRRCRDAHAALGEEFKRIWNIESKPYALDRTMRAYAAAVKRYDGLAARLADARELAEADKPLPGPEAVGLAIASGHAVK